MIGYCPKHWSKYHLDTIQTRFSGKNNHLGTIMVKIPFVHVRDIHISRVSNIESDNSQNVGLEDYNNISDGIFPHFTTPSIKISLG